MTADTKTPANDSAAHDLLRGAHQAGYRFPEGFPGFRASLRYTNDQGRTSGAVEVFAPNQITLDLDADEAARQWVLQEMASIVGHRWPASYEQQDGRYNLTLEPGEHPLGQLIRFNDDRFSSAYRVRNRSLSQINRSMGKMRFSINILEHEPVADGRIVPSQFMVTYWDTDEGRLVRADAYTDSYVPVDGVFLPALRRVIMATDDGLTVQEILLTNHGILSEGSAAQDVPANREHSRTRAG